jgi:hypothetical protein
MTRCVAGHGNQLLRVKWCACFGPNQVFPLAPGERGALFEVKSLKRAAPGAECFPSEARARYLQSCLLIRPFEVATFPITFSCGAT